MLLPACALQACMFQRLIEQAIPMCLINNCNCLIFGAESGGTGGIDICVWLLIGELPRGLRHLVAVGLPSQSCCRFSFSCVDLSSRHTHAMRNPNPVVCKPNSKICDHMPNLGIPKFIISFFVASN